MPRAKGFVKTEPLRKRGMGWWITLYTTDGQVSLGDPEGLHPLTNVKRLPSRDTKPRLL